MPVVPFLFFFFQQEHLPKNFRFDIQIQKMGFFKTFVNTSFTVTLLLILAVVAYVGFIYVAPISTPLSHFAPGSKINTEGLTWVSNKNEDT
jgi:hypothetical protein